MKRRRQVPPQTPSDSTSGSPRSGEPVYLAVGKLRRSHGVEGSIIMDVLTDFPERLRVGRTVYAGDHHEPLLITGIRGHDRALIINFEGFSTPEEVGRLRNMNVYIQASSLPVLPEGEYYHHELLGLKVVDESGQLLGALDQILETGANDVYVVKNPDGKELLLPAVEEVILEVNLERGEIRARPPEYL
jgi:16S rRNA processing protein RimM